MRLPQPSRLRVLLSRSGAIDLASIMVGVIVVGVTAAGVNAFVLPAVPFSQDATAKESLTAVAAGESAVRTLDGAYLAYDSHPDSTFHEFEGDPGIDRPNHRLVVDVSADGWVAAAESRTGAVFVRTSEEPTVFDAEDRGYLLAAGPELIAGGFRVLELPGEMTDALPTGFDRARVQQMLDTITGRSSEDGTPRPHEFPAGTPGGTSDGNGSEEPEPTPEPTPTPEPGIPANTGTVTTVASGYAFRDVTLGPDGTLYATGSTKLGVNGVYRIVDGKVTAIAGATTAGYADGAGAAARFGRLEGLTFGPDGALYVADSTNHRIRRVTLSGEVTTVVGSASGTVDGPVTTARILNPDDVVFDTAGRMYIAEASRNVRIVENGVVRSVNLRTAGKMAASVTPRALAPATDGVWVASQYDSDLVKVNADGTVSRPGSRIDSGSYSLAIDREGSLYLNRVGVIVKLAPDLTETQLAGKSGAYGSVNGVGDAARFAAKGGIAIARDGAVYVADESGQAVRVIR